MYKAWHCSLAAAVKLVQQQQPLMVVLVASRQPLAVFDAPLRGGMRLLSSVGLSSTPAVSASSTSGMGNKEENGGQMPDAPDRHRHPVTSRYLALVDRGALRHDEHQVGREGG